MQIFTKENAIKVLAILVVLFFLFETFSIYSTPRGANIPVDTGTGTDTSTNQSTSLFGMAVANATVVSYGDSLGPSINVAGNSSELQQTISKLKSEGIVTYTSPNQGGVTLNLARGTNVSEVAKKLSPLNFTLLARAEVSFRDPLVFRTEAGPVNLSIKSVRISIDPSVPVGYKIGIKITATIRDDSITESIYEVVPIPQNMFVASEVVELYPKYNAIGVLEWPNRYVNRNKTTEYLSQRFDNVTLQAIVNSTVLFTSPLSSEGLAKLFSLNLSYLRNATSDSMLFYANFTDNGTMESDLAPILSSENTTLYYPLSYLQAEFTTQNYSKEFLNSSLNFSELYVYRKMTVRVGVKLTGDDGRDYTVVKRDYTGLFQFTNQTGVFFPIKIQANVLGDKILDYTVTE